MLEDESVARIRAEQASRLRKRIELEQQIGYRSSVFGHVLEEKDRTYMDTITNDTMR